MEQINKLQDQHDLIMAIKNNDQRVLKVLYQENYGKIEAHVLKNNGSQDAAKDLYQEAFLVVYNHIIEDRFTPQNETAVQGYLYQIARNKWTDYLRSARYKKTQSLKPEIVANHQEEESIENEALEIESLRKQTAAAFNNLGADCKKLLEVFYFDNSSLREIAVQFGIGEASAKNKKYRCLQQLKSLITSKP